MSTLTIKKRRYKLDDLITQQNDNPITQPNRQNKERLSFLSIDILLQKETMLTVETLATVKHMLQATNYGDAQTLRPITEQST